jgi:tyrosine-protein phosphatase YwqE
MIEHELSAGAMVQLNAWSLLGHHGAEAADLAAEFIQRDDPFVLASDAHGPRRPPSLRRGLEELASLGHPRPECATRTPQSLLEHGFSVLAAAAAA